MSLLKQTFTLYKSDKIKLLSYTFLSLHFLFNFLGSPFLKWLFLIELFFLLGAAISVKFENLFLPLLGFFLIEGQGRILWEYHPIVRNSFDIILIVAMLKGMISTRTLVSFKKIPTFVTFLIILHFIWYAVQLFNQDNVGYLGVLAASKIYILPLFFFFLFLKTPELIGPHKIKAIHTFCIYALLLESSLVIFQFFEREELLLAISNYYEVIMRNIFVGPAFRPFGTSFVPGGISVNLFLLLPFVLFIKPEGKKHFIIQITTIVSSWIALFLLQVRSATIKHLAICFFFSLTLFFISTKRIHHLIKIITGIALFILLVNNIGPLQKIFPDVDLTYSTERFSTITYDISKLKTKRISFDMAIKELIQKISANPVGLGPGRSGAATTFSLDIIKKDPIYNISSSWAHDNLLISLAIDLGLGMIFYLLVIILLPLMVIFYTIKKKKGFSPSQLRIMVVISITLLMIIVGNWGAIGIPYNPESFIFWLLISLGIHHHAIA